MNRGYRLIWRRAGTECGLPWIQEWTFGISSLVENMLAWQEGLLFLYWVTKLSKVARWLDNQQLVRWSDLSSTLRQGREIISGPSPAAKTRIFSLNTTHFRVVLGLLTGHNTMRRKYYLMGLTSSPLCRRCGAEKETSAHTLCECENLVSLRNTYLGSFPLHQEEINPSKTKSRMF